MSLDFRQFVVRWSKLVCLLGLLWGPASLNAQDDSLSLALPDTIPELDPITVRLDASAVDSLSSLTLREAIYDANQFVFTRGVLDLRRPNLYGTTAVVDTPLVKQVVQTLEAQLPEVYKDSGKLKLHIPIFWREDIYMPLPKAFEKTGPRPPYDPTVAWQRSLILPGWGQAYNRGYWKMPIFYVGYVAGAVWIGYNHRLYLQTRQAFLAKISPDPFDDDPTFQNFDSEGIRRLRNEFRNQRDQGVLILAGWHLVQVAEAYVDAHMKGYDVSEDLSFKAHPTLISPTIGTSPSFGLGLTFSF